MVRSPLACGVPTACPDVPAEVLWPRNTWTDATAYDRQARELRVRPVGQRVRRLRADLLDRHLELVAPAARVAGARPWVVVDAAGPFQAYGANPYRRAQAALVALDPQTGDVLAVVGGRDYEQTQLNRVLARRQPGSVFKPFVYTAAVRNGFPISYVVNDRPLSMPAGDGGRWEPRNFDGRFRVMLAQTGSGERSLSSVHMNDTGSWALGLVTGTVYRLVGSSIDALSIARERLSTRKPTVCTSRSPAPVATLGARESPIRFRRPGLGLIGRRGHRLVARRVGAPAALVAAAAAGRLVDVVASPAFRGGVRRRLGRVSGHRPDLGGGRQVPRPPSNRSFDAVPLDGGFEKLVMLCRVFFKNFRGKAFAQHVAMQIGI